MLSLENLVSSWALYRIVLCQLFHAKEINKVTKTWTCELTDSSKMKKRKRRKKSGNTHKLHLFDSLEVLPGTVRIQQINLIKPMAFTIQYLLRVVPRNIFTGKHGCYL